MKNALIGLVDVVRHAQQKHMDEQIDVINETIKCQLCYILSENKSELIETEIDASVIRSTKMVSDCYKTSCSLKKTPKK